MKRVIIILLIFCYLTPVNLLASTSLAKNSTSAVIIESTTGKILFEKNKDEKRAPASMTKIMTMILLMEKINNEDIKLEDKVYISKNASSMGGSQIYIEENSYVTVEDLLKGIAIASANDASVAIAEHIAGTEEEFVKLMNAKASSLGLTKTVFKNSHGLDEEGHYTTAYEMALMAKELLNYPSILKYTSTYEDYLIRDKNTKFWLVNTNKLIRFYKGVDGLKTGYTKNAGHCLTSTMEKNGMRVITVVMNSGSTENRSSDTVSLLEYAFSMYYANPVIDKNNILGSTEVLKGVKEKLDYKVSNDVKIILSKNDKKDGYSYDIKLDKITAPIKMGDKVGILTLYDSNKEIVNMYDLVSNDNIDKANFIEVFINNLRKISSGNY